MSDDIKTAVADMIRASIDKTVNDTIAARSAEFDYSGEDDSLNEGWKVEATPQGGKSSVELTVSGLPELKRLAKSGKYGYFTVTKPNGDEIEYHVDFEDDKKLVEM